MHLSRLSLHDFRSYEAADIALQPGVTAVIGLNGQGKTNLVEAIHYLAHQRSHRVAKDLPLVRAGKSSAVIGARVEWRDREQTIELEVNAKGANRARVAGAPRRPREALGVVRSVIFAPEDLALVKGEPGVRRRFIDDLLVSLTPRFAGILTDYERVARQRTALLKSVAGSWRRDNSYQDTLAVWNDQLARLGAEVTGARLDLLDRLTRPVGEAYATVAPDAGELQVNYESSWLDTSGQLDAAALNAAMHHAIAEHSRAELERGMTLIGPHRDDLLLTLGGLPAKGYASHGESWSVALALRLATYNLQRESFDAGGDPILLLDDVFAELDSSRRARLAAVAVQAEQVIVTAAVAADVPTELLGRELSVERTSEGVSRARW
ncbi:MAG: DNA replication/repair protein RecF [Actinobacteria bacterium]|nr:DNA replication/repair protein RecF [Actinomycetota bacterium]MCB9411536.1 DNA replication/repair protein RecF [Actinomycetota bacterium]